jgi:Trk K+ transport system NAD-binding subunit
MMWLTSAPGTPLPPRRDPVPRGRWVVYGDGWTSRELTEDLRKEGLEVTTARGAEGAAADHRGQEAALDAAGAEDAVAFVATTNNDMTNLWLIERVREVNPDAFLVSVQTPALADFLAEVPHHDGTWAADMVSRLTERCGSGAPDVWRVPLTVRDAPALTDWLEAGSLRLGDLLRDPNGRHEPLGVVPLALKRGAETTMAPDGDELLGPGDELLLAGRVSAWKALDATLTDESTAAYVIDDRFVPTGWLWRRLSGDRTDERV